MDHEDHLSEFREPRQDTRASPDVNSLVTLLNGVAVALGGLYATTESLAIVAVAVVLAALLSVLVTVRRHRRWS